MDESKRNQGEASIALSYCQELLKAGIKLDQIAIIAPYNAQVALIKFLGELEQEELEVGTVNGFQGLDCKS